jgi:hypothetical protein
MLYWRILKKAGHDTYDFFKRKIVLAVTAILLVGGTTWWYYADSFDSFRSVQIPLSCYGAILVCIFVVNLIRAPILLDKEKTAEIEGLKGKVSSAENTKNHRDGFAALMNEGEGLANKLRSLTHFTQWQKEEEDWINRSSQTLIDVGLPHEAAAFRHAREITYDNKGVSSSAYQREFFRQRLDSCRSKLEDIVQRKIP